MHKNPCPDAVDQSITSYCNSSKSFNLANPALASIMQSYSPWDSFSNLVSTFPDKLTIFIAFK